MKNKDRIKKFLTGRSWVNKGEIVNELVSWGGGYADTIGRQLRKYSERNKNPILDSRPNPNGKGTEYRLRATQSNTVKAGDTIYDTAKAIRDAKETNYQLI